MLSSQLDMMINLHDMTTNHDMAVIDMQVEPENLDPEGVPPGDTSILQLPKYVL